MEADTDLMAVAQKIFENKVMEGLLWQKQYKIIPIAFGINKLQLVCIIEDDLVSVDSLVGSIEEMEEVQSVDILCVGKV